MAPTRQVTLAVAEFLDSSPARALTEVRGPDLREIATALIESAFEDLGKKPRLLDGEDAAPWLAGVAARLRPRDARAPLLPAILGAYLAHLESSEVVPNAFELRRDLEGQVSGCVARIRAGEIEPRHTKGETVVHRAEKLGRNDPCFCGSGKKFKKCHGKA